MKHQLYYVNFAQAYGQGTYSSCSYNDSTSCTTSGSGTSGSGTSNGGLADTGLAIAVIVTLACLIVFVAMMVRIWRRPSRKPVAEVVPEDDEITQSPRDDQQNQ